MFTETRRGKIALCAVAALLSAGVVAPSLSAPKDKPGTQGDAAKKALEKQKDIAKALKEKQANSPAELERQLAELKFELEAEQSRSTLALEALRKDLKGFQDAGDKKKSERAQKQIDKETATSAEKVATLQKRISDLQARLDQAQSDTQPPK